MSSFDVARSDHLHDRVRAFIDQSMKGETPRDTFDALAVEIAVHQAASGSGVERLFAARNLEPSRLREASSIPAVPTDVFKVHRVACHAPELDRTVFFTSGTTVGTQGRLHLRRTGTYRHAARVWGRHMLFPDALRLHWILLAPPYASHPSSSLGFMLDDFGGTFGASVTWAVHNDRLELDAVLAAVERARSDAAPIIVAGASFAFVHLLDDLGTRTIPLGERGRVMQTGGFKGRSREVDATTLRRSLASAFELPVELVVAEYGMTELGSQAYEGCLRKALQLGEPQSSPDVFLAPPWMRVHAVDPVSLEQIPPGQTGIARIEDLTNVDSAVAVQTADRVQCCEGGFRLLGRAAGAPPRGCSIGVDEILGQLSPEGFEP